MIEKAIPTLYNNIRFRSRLEATWARFFDLLEWPWEYEPLDLKGYIPDFILPFQWECDTNSYHPVLVEVKPVLDLRELRTFTNKTEASGWKHEALILGAGLLESPTNLHIGLGLLSEGPSPSGEWWWEEAPTMKCLRCQRLSFFHSEGSYHSRVCGHYDGDGLLGDGNEAFKKVWGQAKNHTQWTKNSHTK